MKQNWYPEQINNYFIYTYPSQRYVLLFFYIKLHPLNVKKADLTFYISSMKADRYYLDWTFNISSAVIIYYSTSACLFVITNMKYRTTYKKGINP